MGVKVAPDGKRVYVATGRHGTVEVIDPATNKVIGSVKVGTRPWGLAITADGKKLYTANGPSNDVSVVDTDQLRVIATISAGQSPWGVGIGPAPAAPR
jgi:YVTN family beta-propeller protein